MSLDRGLKSKGRMSRQRNVLTRAERLEILEDRGDWRDEDSVFGLDKVRVHRVKRRKAAKAEAEAAPAEAAGVEAEAEAEKSEETGAE